MLTSSLLRTTTNRLDMSSTLHRRRLSHHLNCYHPAPSSMNLWRCIAMSGSTSMRNPSRPTRIRRGSASGRPTSSPCRRLGRCDSHGVTGSLMIAMDGCEVVAGVVVAECFSGFSLSAICGKRNPSALPTAAGGRRHVGAPSPPVWCRTEPRETVACPGPRQRPTSGLLGQSGAKCGNVENRHIRECVNPNVEV